MITFQFQTFLILILLVKAFNFKHKLATGVVFNCHRSKFIFLLLLQIYHIIKTNWIQNNHFLEKNCTTTLYEKLQVTHIVEK